MVELGLEDRERACLLAIHAVDRDIQGTERWIEYSRISRDPVDEDTRTILKMLAARGWIVWQEEPAVRVHMTTVGRKFATELSPG